MQPGYFPWPGFFDLIYRVDTFVVYDSVKYTKATWRNRNRIRMDCKQGWKWLSVPVEKDAENKRIRDVRIAPDPGWRKKHLNMIRAGYGKAPFFDEYMPLFEPVFKREWEFLVDLDMHILEIMLNILGGCSTRLVYSSDLQLTDDLEKTEKLLEICRAVDADSFYDTAGALAFFDHSVFSGSGIHVEFQDYSIVEYPQVYSPFMGGLSALDIIMNCGPGSLRVILGDYYEEARQTE